MIIQHNHLNPTGAFVPARANFSAPDPQQEASSRKMVPWYGGKKEGWHSNT
jgi:hypothetical protein